MEGERKKGKRTEMCIWRIEIMILKQLWNCPWCGQCTFSSITWSVFATLPSRTHSNWDANVDGKRVLRAFSLYEAWSIFTIVFVHNYVSILYILPTDTYILNIYLVSQYLSILICVFVSSIKWNNICFGFVTANYTFTLSEDIENMKQNLWLNGP